MDHGFKSEERILRLKDIKKITGLSRSTIYAWIADGKFPEHINLGNRSVGWVASEIHEWVENRISISRQSVSVQKLDIDTVKVTA